MGTHALLSASSSHRWLACPPSARLCENYEDTGSEYRTAGYGRPQPVRTQIEAGAWHGNHGPNGEPFLL